MNSTKIEHIFKEIQIRTVWTLICFIATCVCCYSFSEELLFLLAKPFLIVYKPNSSFISTQLTETLNTYVTVSIILSVFFCTPNLIYQLWCFFIPSCNYTERMQLSRMCLLSTLALFCMLLISAMWLLPTLWWFLYQLSNTSGNVFTIQLQPKIYDFIILTIRILLLLFICSQIPVFLIWLIECGIIKATDCIKHRKSVWFCCILIAAFLSPPDLWCQLLALLPISIVIESTIFYSIISFHYSHLTT